MFTEASETVLDLAPLIRAALEVVPNDEIGGMTRLMQSVAEATKSYGCCLWRKRTLKHDFVMLAGSYPASGIITLSRIATEGTCAGYALETGQWIINDLEGKKNPIALHRFISACGINREIACRVEVPSSSENKDEGWRGTLNLYRRGRRSNSPQGAEDDGEFTPRDQATLKSICSSIPLLFRATRDHDALELFRKTEETIASYVPPKNAEEWEQNLKATITRFGMVLQRAFRCRELSIFLRKKQDSSSYRCWFTTEGVHRAATIDERNDYRHGALDKGFSGLCLLVDDTIRIGDIRHSEDEAEAWRKLFPAFKGHISRGITKKTLEEEGLSEEDAPPQSMMCTRLAAGAEIFGFVRCRARSYGPVIYHAEDGRLLYLVCQSFSQNLAAWWEAHHWDELLEGTAEPKYEVLGESKERYQHLAKALDLIDHLIPGADINTARVLDESRKNLVFAAVSIQATNELRDPLGPGLAQKFPIDHPIASNGAAEVFKDGKTKRFLIEDTRIRSSFRDVREIIIAPIKDHKNEVYGVLDARSRSAFPFYAGRLMGIIGRLVGMQHAHLLEDQKNRKHAEQIARQDEERKQDALKRMEEAVEAERRTVQAFEDAAHQIKTPLATARMIVELSKSYGIPMDTGSLETSLRRADLASKLINTFADIASGREPHLNKQDMFAEELCTLILVLCNDVARCSNEERFLKFEVNETSIKRNAPRTLSVDKDLISEAIYNLLDNAEKYSHVRGLIRTSGGTSRAGKFFISVTSRGERIEKGEENDCLKRRWRSPRLAGKTGSGSGLGLYIVDKIMKAHSGRVIVVPTDDHTGVTEIRLEFQDAKS